MRLVRAHRHGLRPPIAPGSVPGAPVGTIPWDRPPRLARVQEEVLEGEAVEEPLGSGGAPEAGAAAEDVRPLPERRRAAELDAWRAEVRTVAMAAAGGIAAGAATVAAVNAVRAHVERRKPTRVLRRGGKAERVLASRSFLIDVHVLDR